MLTDETKGLHYINLLLTFIHNFHHEAHKEHKVISLDSWRFNTKSHGQILSAFSAPSAV